MKRPGSRAASNEMATLITESGVTRGGKILCRASSSKPRLIGCQPVGSGRSLRNVPHMVVIEDVDRLQQVVTVCDRSLDDIEILFVDEGVPHIGPAVGDRAAPALTRA